MTTRRQLLSWLSFTPFAAFASTRKSEPARSEPEFRYQRLYQIEDIDRQTGERYLNHYCTKAYAEAHVIWLNNNMFHRDHRIVETDLEGIILFRTKTYNELLHVCEQDAYQYLEEHANSLHPSCHEIADNIRANKQARIMPVLIHSSIRKIRG